MGIVELLGLAASVSLLSGWRLYLTVFATGLAMYSGMVDLPENLKMLDVLASPWVIGIAGIGAVAEFFADKVPWLDSVWDALHSFLRIPAGAALAGSLFPELGGSGMTALVALLGGGVAASAQLTKTGSRAVINTSPEPFTNIAASMTEEAMLGAGLWTAFNHPLVFLVLLMVFIVLTVVLAAFFIRAIRRMLASRNAPAT